MRTEAGGSIGGICECDGAGELPEKLDAGRLGAGALGTPDAPGTAGGRRGTGGGGGTGRRMGGASSALRSSSSLTSSISTSSSSSPVSGPAPISEPECVSDPRSDAGSASFGSSGIRDPEDTAAGRDSSPLSCDPTGGRQADARALHAPRSHRGRRIFAVPKETGGRAWPPLRRGPRAARPPERSGPRSLRRARRAFPEPCSRSCPSSS